MLGLFRVLKEVGQDKRRHSGQSNRTVGTVTAPLSGEPRMIMKPSQG